MLVLHIAAGSAIVLRHEGVEQLRTHPCDDYGTFMRDTIYPALSIEDRKVWHRTAISNLDLQDAIQAFQ